MELHRLRFENEGYQYEVYQEWTAESQTMSAGVRVRAPGAASAVEIEGDPATIRGSLALRVECLRTP